MQFVNNKFYYWYNGIVTALGGILLAAVIASWTWQPAEFLKEEWGFGLVTGSIALFQVVYGLIVFKKESKNNVWAAALFTQFIFMLNVINLTHNTGQFASWFMVLWALSALTSGIFGVYPVIGNGFFVTIYFVLVATGEAGTKQFEPSMLVKLFAVYVCAVAGYAFWRRLYVDQESQQVKKLTGELKTKEQQAELLIQSIIDGMIVTTPEGKVTLINNAAAIMTGWNIDEAVGINIKQVAKLLHENGDEITDEENPFFKVQGQTESISQELQLSTRNGKNMLVSLVVSPVISPSTNSVSGVIAIMRDISKERAEEQQRADFISTASHEMRTPVAAIEGYLALALNDKVSNIDSKARGFLEKAHSSTQHLGKLFQDLLTSAKAEDGRLVSNPVVTEMGDLLEQITDSLKFSVEKSGLLMDFAVGSSQDVPALSGGKVVKPLYYVYADPDRLREVVTNLFDNAIKYTDAGKISVGLTGNNEVVQFFIADTGPGIPAEDIPHLFQKFYRIDSSATRTIGGTGLGLFISRKIIELYKGRIWVESELGKGSTFYVNLPRISSQKATALQNAQTNKLPDINNT